MEKRAVGKQMGGFMQTRARTRPYRVDTLLGKDLHSKKPSEVLEDPIHDAEAKYDAQLAADEGSEFVQKESSAKELFQARLTALQGLKKKAEDTMGISFFSFADEMEKIASRALDRAYKAGRVGVDDLAALLQKGTPQTTSRMSGRQMSPERVEKLYKIKKTRYMRQGMSEQEATRAARDAVGTGATLGKKGPASERADRLFSQGDLRAKLKGRAAAAQGGDAKAVREAERLARKEQRVLRGDVKAGTLTEGHRAYRGGHLSGKEKARRSLADRAELEAMDPKERASLLAVRKSSDRAARKSLKQQTERLGTSAHIPTPDAGAPMVRGELRNVVSKRLARRQAAEEAAKRRATEEAAKKKSMAETEKRTQEQQAALSRQQAAAPPAPAPAAPPAPAPRPAPAPAPAPAPQPAAAAPPAPAAAPTPAAPPAAAPAPAPAAGGGGVHPGLIAAGVGAPLVLGAGGLAAHHLMQQRAQQQGQGQ